ncbi:chemotaxis protein CheA [Sphingomonas sp. GlSt437]|uniref:chemotaxis protein CheA n=1 Tax=Sphingomonas sp. GlSt437 TaxID=3389970 RepID=UPI003A87F6E9
MDDLLQEFIAETRETLAALSGEIVMWEADPQDRARLDAIFRFVHTVKGSCGFLDLPRLSRLSHAAEDALASVRSGERVPDAALVTAVLAIVDRIGDVIEAIDVGAGLDDTGEDLLIAALAPASADPAADEPADAPDNAGEGPAIPNAPAAIGQRTQSRSVRLNVDLLDKMMSGMSDMVLARNELARRLRHDAVDPAIEAALERLSMTVAEMRDTVTRTRMQKIDGLFSALPRLVRDAAAELGKSVSLAIDGADVELDREMIELMRDPLVHIIRNAIDHGLESPADRRAAGKRETGRLAVGARQSGNQIIVEIADDGRGIDTGRLVAKAAAAGVKSEAELRVMSERARLDLIFQPGLSTKDQVTKISGRGVGMDVVRANIEQIGGRIELNNRPGRGLTITIHVPLTLSIISTVVVGVGGQRFALPRQSVEEIVPVRGDAVRVDLVGDAPIATVRERRLPLVDLGATLKMPDRDAHTATMLAIVAVNGGSYALGVDTVLDTEELVIKPAAPAVMMSGLYAGQTLPDTGLPMLLLDGAGVASRAGVQFNREAVVDESDDRAVVLNDDHAALLFLDLDGVRRAVPLAAVDRVELVPVSAARDTAGALRLTIDGGIIPLQAVATLPESGEIGVLRFDDGESEIGYAIAEALDIISLDEPMVPAREPGPIAGVLIHEGEQIELIDLHWLFAAQGETKASSGVPICLLTGSDAGWMESFLRPVIEGAGYRVATSLSDGERATVALAMEDDDNAAIVADRAPSVVRLSRRRTQRVKRGELVYRYDRATLVRVLEEYRLAGGM